MEKKECNIFFFWTKFNLLRGFLKLFADANSWEAALEKGIVNSLTPRKLWMLRIFIPFIFEL